MRNLFRIFSTLTLSLGMTALHGWGYNNNDCCDYNPCPEYNYNTNACCDYGYESNYDKGGFWIAGSGMWAVPSETGIGTFTDSWQYLESDGSILALSKPSKAKYEGAWGIRGGYDFPCSGNSVEVGYFHLHNDKHNYNDTSDGPISFGSAFFNLGIPLPPGSVFISDAHLKYTLDQVDAKLGHWFTTCDGDLRLHPSFGARFVNLKHDLTFLVGHVRSRYQGGGPLVGFDVDYQIFKNFFVGGRFNAAALMGEVKANNFLSFSTPFLSYKSPTTDRIAYSFDGSVSLAYQYEFCNQSRIRLEGGYRVASYVGALDVIQAFTPTAESPTTSRIGTINTNNFGFSGPYLELSFHM